MAPCQSGAEHYDNNNPPQHYTDMVNLSSAVYARAISAAPLPTNSMSCTMPLNAFLPLGGALANANNL